MRAKREPNIVRPLLFATRLQIEEYLQSQGLSYVTDRTNDDESYTRNYIRKTVLPTFKNVNPSYDFTMLRTSELIAEEVMRLTALQSSHLKAHCCLLRKAKFL